MNELENLSETQLQRQLMRLRKSAADAQPPGRPEMPTGKTGSNCPTSGAAPDTKPKPDPNILMLDATGEDREQALAHAALNPTLRAVINIRSFAHASVANFEKVDLATLAKDLAAHSQKVREGDLGQAETMLAGQAYTLDSIFNALLNYAHVNLGKHLEAAETYLRLAYRAQSQCRATLETLSFIKNPKSVAFIRQQNNAAGHQQVNNRARARKKKKGNTNKLLEQNDGERLEQGAAPVTELDDPAMAALEKIDRAENAGRQSDRRAQRLQGWPNTREVTRAGASVKANRGRKG